MSAPYSTAIMDPKLRIQVRLENQTGSPTEEFPAGDLLELTFAGLRNHVFEMAMPNENHNQHTIHFKYQLVERHGTRWVNFDDEEGLGFAMKSKYASDYMHISVSIVKKEAVLAPMMAASSQVRDKTTAIKKSRTTKAKVKAPASARNSNGRPKKASRGSPCMVYNGIPDENLEGGWPVGWTLKKVKRSDGKIDSYWYSPIENKKLRSMVAVKSFMKALKENGGDEEEAWKKIQKKLT